MEAQIDQEMEKLDNLGEDDLATIRKQRMADNRKRKEKTKEWLEKGHGEYTEIQTEKEFFELMKGEERMICHFYRENWPCKVMDKHMAILCKRHIETKFCKINAEKSPFLVDRLKVWMLPTLALIRLQKTVDYVAGFDQLGGKDDFSTEVLEERLAKSEMIDYDWGHHSRAAAAATEGKSIRSGIYTSTGSDEDSDFEN
ncbi:MAG: hypothetical protein WDW38_005662 [Sanguina aurantia]